MTLRYDEGRAPTYGEHVPIKRNLRPSRQGVPQIYQPQLLDADLPVDDESHERISPLRSTNMEKVQQKFNQTSKMNGNAVI